MPGILPYCAAGGKSALPQGRGSAGRRGSVSSRETLSPSALLSATGRDIEFESSREDEGVWLERRIKKKGIVRIAKARMTTMETGHLEFVFDAPIRRGNYFVAVYTRAGKSTDYKAIRVCRQVKAK